MVEEPEPGGGILPLIDTDYFYDLLMEQQEASMEQISLFEENQILPASYTDVEELINRFVRENETDKDFFSWGKDRKNGGKLGYLYDTKIIEFFPATEDKRPVLKAFLPGDRVIKLKSQSSAEELLNVLNVFKSEKKTIFRNLITETFACCNDFKKCSDAKECIHTEDRFYNGCLYRKNLEAGKIFYGINKNAGAEE